MLDEKTLKVNGLNHLARAMDGHVVVTNTPCLDAVIEDDRQSLILTIPNPNRIGLLDEFLAWNPDHPNNKTRCRGCGDENGNDDLYEGYHLCVSCTQKRRQEI